MDLVTQGIENLRAYQAGKPMEELARERGLTDIIKLASNENPLGPSPKAILAAVGALGSVHRYPDGAGFRLRKAIADFHDVTVDEVIHGNGSNEIIELLIRTFMTPEHHIVFGSPAFSMYPVVATAHNVSFTKVPTNSDLVHDLPGMLSAVRPNTKIILIDNPNNPTGTFVSQNQIADFLARVPKEVIVILDEAYFEFATAPEYPDGLRLRAQHPRVMVLRTFSKAYGLAGLRVGYGIGPAELVNYLHRLRAPFNVSLPSQEAGIAALSDTGHLAETVKLNASERTRLEHGLARFARRVYPSQANFVLADFGQSGAELYDALLDQGVIVRPVPGLDTFLRISVGLPQENDRFLEALDRVLRK
jgi:histidinol-phosphate aminotransferase